MLNRGGGRLQRCREPEARVHAASGYSSHVRTLRAAADQDGA
jgi:hypothetical protein